MAGGEGAQAKPGDIIGRLGSLNHHAVVQKVEGDQVTTINGNGVNQEIHIRTEPLSLYSHFYSALPGAGAEEVVAKWETDRAARLAREAAERKAKKR